MGHELFGLGRTKIHSVSRLTPSGLRCLFVGTRLSGCVCARAAGKAVGLPLRNVYANIRKCDTGKNIITKQCTAEVRVCAEARNWDDSRVITVVRQNLNENILKLNRTAFSSEYPHNTMLIGR